MLLSETLWWMDDDNTYGGFLFGGSENKNCNRRYAEESKCEWMYFRRIGPSIICHDRFSGEGALVTGTVMYGNETDVLFLSILLQSILDIYHMNALGEVYHGKKLNNERLSNLCTLEPHACDQAWNSIVQDFCTWMINSLMKYENRKSGHLAEA